ncbi:hypothetical protein R1flu_011825 [Riccia fluitans]|uniref:BED-type domain-containing protein n=1 Tax=Riccia fluitans TaxID=41844 RepID=A0ABD1ZA10_9MARC
MASRSCRREGKLPELPELSELPEEGELMPQQQQQQPWAPKARQTVLFFVEPPIPRPSKYKEFGLPEPKKELFIKVMEQFIVFREHKNNVEGVWCKCKWCGKEYGHNVTRLTQHCGASLLQDSEATWSCRHSEERDPTGTSRVVSVHPNN